MTQALSSRSRELRHDLVAGRDQPRHVVVPTKKSGGRQGLLRIVANDDAGLDPIRNPARAKHTSAAIGETWPSVAKVW